MSVYTLLPLKSSLGFGHFIGRGREEKVIIQKDVSGDAIRTLKEGKYCRAECAYGLQVVVNAGERLVFFAQMNFFTE